MQTGSRDERELLAHIGLIAHSLVRIAAALEQSVYGTTGPQLREVKAAVTARAEAELADEQTDATAYKQPPPGPRPDRTRKAT